MWRKTLRDCRAKLAWCNSAFQGRHADIEAVTRRLAAALPGLEVRPVRQIAAAEGRSWVEFAD